MAPSALPYMDGVSQVPHEMTRADMDRVKADFVRATLMGEDAGFDMLELHCGHGYLLSSFLTPISNHRTDEYGDSIENRLRFPLEVFEAMRAAWPKHKPTTSYAQRLSPKLRRAARTMAASGSSPAC